MNLTKNSTKFNSLVKELASNLFRKKLKEMTTTGDIAGYDTPYAFKSLSKKKKKNIEKQTGYSFVGEGISNDEWNKIKSVIRKEVSDILRDIWIKRNSWGGR
tara:strand:+ start:133 stop:438 length:306 start_codon:yes stop_codon:yes gene_type:complete